MKKFVHHLFLFPPKNFNALCALHSLYNNLLLLFFMQQKNIFNSLIFFFLNRIKKKKKITKKLMRPPSNTFHTQHVIGTQTHSSSLSLSVNKFLLSIVFFFKRTIDAACEKYFNPEINDEVVDNVVTFLCFQVKKKSFAGETENFLTQTFFFLFFFTQPNQTNFFFFFAGRSAQFCYHFCCM